MKFAWLLCGFSKTTSFQFGGSALIFFCVVVDNELFLASGSKSTGFSCGASKTASYKSGG